MLWGQTIKVYTDRKNLTQDALDLTSDRVYRWQLLLEEFAPEIVFIKGIDLGLLAVLKQSSEVNELA
jgi:hypothetical protein